MEEPQALESQDYVSNYSYQFFRNKVINQAIHQGRALVIIVGAILGLSIFVMCVSWTFKEDIHELKDQVQALQSQNFIQASISSLYNRNIDGVVEIKEICFSPGACIRIQPPLNSNQ